LWRSWEVRSSTCCSRVSLSCRSCCSASLRSVMSEGHAGQQADAAIARTDRPGPDVDPVHRAVRPDVAKLDDEIGATVQRVLQNGLHARLIFGVHRAQPIVVGERVALVPAEVRLGDGRALQHQKFGVQLPRAEPSGFQRVLQALLALQQFFESGAGFVLSSTPAHRGAHQTDERGRMKRPLQKRDIAEHFAQVRRGVLFRTAVMSQQHDGKVRPGRLIGQQAEQRVDVRAAQRLISDDRKSRTGHQFTAQLRQIVGNDRRVAGFLQHGQRKLAVASEGGQDNRPLR
jgi:hypothetical protein